MMNQRGQRPSTNAIGPPNGDPRLQPNGEPRLQPNGRTNNLHALVYNASRIPFAPSFFTMSESKDSVRPAILVTPLYSLPCDQNQG